jgi:hypothetical protein
MPSGFLRRKVDAQCFRDQIERSRWSGYPLQRYPQALRTRDFTLRLPGARKASLSLCQEGVHQLLLVNRYAVLSEKSGHLDGTAPLNLIPVTGEGHQGAT